MRRTVYVDIPDGNNTLKFEITQMPSTKLEDWLLRALLCIGPALEMPEGSGLEDVGKALASKGYAALAGIDYGKAKPLLDEMLETASRIVDDKVKIPVRLSTIDGYMESVQALFRLRIECFKANLGFFLDGEQSATQGDATTPAGSSVIRMSSR